MEVSKHLLLELLDEDGVWPHEVLAGGQEVLMPGPHGGGVDPETVPDTGHGQAHQQQQSSQQQQDNPGSLRQDFDEIDSIILRSMVVWARGDQSWSFVS